MNDTLKKVLVVIGIISVSVAVGRFTAPSKVVEKEKIVYQDRIVEKENSKQTIDKKNHKVYVKLTTVKPDGTKTTEVKIFDSDNIEITKTDANYLSNNKTIDKTTEKTVEYKKDEVLISLSAKTSLSSPTSLSYGLNVNKRLLGPIYIGAFGYTDGTCGGSLGLSF